MNIFYLSHDVKECAQFHNSKHVIKMILEYSQLLSTAHRILDNGCLSQELDAKLYKLTHKNHPSAIWVRQSISNYMWLSHLLVELCKEYTYRYGKVHKCERDGLVDVLLNTVPNNISNNPFTEPTPAMPDDVKVKGNSIASYRNYYVKNKQHLAKWSGKINNRDIPNWYTFLNNERGIINASI